MNLVNKLNRRLVFALCVGLGSAALVSTALMQQSGGPYVLNPSVIPGGGGTSTNGNTSVTGSIGQAILGASNGGAFSLNGGFWQAASPCSAPGISSQPNSQTACAGSQVSFSVTANGTGVTYQWRKNTVNINGATSATLILNSVGAGDAAPYDCVVSASCGSTVTSSAATLTVNTFSLSSSGQSFPAAGGIGSFDVLVASSCPWTAVSNDLWITITGGASGSGNGAVSYSVAANTGGGRTGTVTAGGLTYTISQAAPTAITLISFNATSYDTGVFIEWQTGLEIDNLGFNIHREESGKLSPVNRQLLAGSAFTVGGAIALGSGMSYEWWDNTPASKTTRYWLEDRDLNGASTWRGPFDVVPSAGKERPSRVEQARTLASLGSSKGDSFAYDPRATLPQAAPSIGPPLPPVFQSTALKIAVENTAWYKLTQAELVAAGLDAATDPRRLQLFVDGRQQPILLDGEHDGRLDAADSVEFYGIGVDSPYSKTRTYWLVAGKDPGQRIQTVQSSAKPNPSGGFACTTERRDRTIYFAALLNGERENFFGSVLTTQPLNQALTAKHIDTQSSTARLELGMQGVTQYPHQIIVQFNGANLGYMFYQGQANSTVTLSVPSSLVREGVNTVTLTTTGAPSDVSLVDYIRLTYQHSYAADDDRLRLTAQGGQPLTISGFSSDAIRVFDVTDPTTVRELKGEIDKNEAGYHLSLYAPGSGERALVALTDARAQSPSMLALDHASSWRSENNGADLLIITASQFFNQAAKLKALRESQGMSVAIADVEDIYDEFSYGQKTPDAMRQFLRFASKNWKRAIRYALFLGDASYDPKDHLGLGDSDLVPTRLIDTLFMETASDDWLADFNNDGIADIAIGRLPARTEREAELLINKLIVYEKAGGSQEALLVADRNDGYDFEGVIDGLRRLIPGDLRVTSVKRGQMGDSAAKAALIEALNRGQKLVSYSGHGSANVWRGNLLTDADASQLQNGERLSVFVMMNCLNGYFQDPRSDSLSEALAKAETGGAIAVWASSAMTFPEGQIEMTKEFYRRLFNDRSIRLGNAVLNAKATIFDPDVRRTWILFGDPSMRLK